MTTRQFLLAPLFLMAFSGMANAVVSFSGFTPFEVEFNGPAIDVQYSPNSPAGKSERELGLTRYDRRDVQSALADLGYRPGTVDGVLGQRSRSAIAAWQSAQGFEATGYLSGRQFVQLLVDGRLAGVLAIAGDQSQPLLTRRDNAFWKLTGAAGTVSGLNLYLTLYPDGSYAGEARGELERIRRAERRAAKLEAERADRDFWARTGAAGTIVGLASYLEQYPGGLFSGPARAQLTALQDQRARAEVNADWETARSLDTIRGYRAFLDRHPHSIWSDQARQRLNQLRRTQSDNTAEREAWREAYALDTIRSYEYFLKNYPNSSYAPEARQRLQVLRRQAVDSTTEDRDWREAERLNTVRAYRAFLATHPQSNWAQLARERIRQIESGGGTAKVGSDPLQAAMLYEEQNIRNDNQRNKIERALQELGYRPGPVDGVFTVETRDALRQFQAKIGIPVTGYVDGASAHHLRPAR